MQFNLFIPQGLRACFDAEIELSRHALRDNRLVEAWHHLERAHILGQAYPWEHTLAHWKMLQFGFKIKNSREIRGQLLRLLVGGVKSFVGKIPVGNTGGANVPPLQPMEIPEDLAKILQQYNNNKKALHF